MVLPSWKPPFLNADSMALKFLPCPPEDLFPFYSARIVAGLLRLHPDPVEPARTRGVGIFHKVIEEFIKGREVH